MYAYIRPTGPPKIVFDNQDKNTINSAPFWLGEFIYLK